MSENSRTDVLFGRATIRRSILALPIDAPERRLHLRAIGDRLIDCPPRLAAKANRIAETKPWPGEWEFGY